MEKKSLFLATMLKRTTNHDLRCPPFHFNQPMVETMPGAREISSNGFADAAVTEGVCLNLRTSKTESARETVLHPPPGAHSGGISLDLCIPK